MERKPMFWLTLTVGVMLLFPRLAVMLVPPKAGMGAMLLLFYGIDPLYSLTAGYYAGKQIRKLWWLPAITAGAFLAGAWLFLEPGETGFLTYGGIYFALGMEAMLVSRLITGRREGNG